jgi:hypothetical protein
VAPIAVLVAQSGYGFRFQATSRHAAQFSLPARTVRLYHVHRSI